MFAKPAGTHQKPGVHAGPVFSSVQLASARVSRPTAAQTASSANLRRAAQRGAAAAETRRSANMRGAT